MARTQDASTVTTTVEKITPEISEKWLKTIKVNRPLSQDNIVNMAIKMDSDEWSDNGETIKFYDNGELFDGQHRLRACVLAGKPFFSSVSRGITDRKAFSTVDVGRPRSNADIFALSGYIEARIASAVALMLMFYRAGNLTLRGPRGTREQLNFSKGFLKGKKVIKNYSRAVDKDKLRIFAEPYRDSINHAVKVVKRLGLKHRLVPHSLASTCFVLFSEKSITEAESFIRDLSTGAGLNTNDPVYRLREKMIANATSEHSKLSRWAIMYLMLKSWNKRRAGEKVGFLRMDNKNDKMPKVK